jgi:hypothetical protein
MPILNAKMAKGDYRPHYEEREITEPVDLCDERGALNPEAIGWSRFPLVRANLSRHWPRKKKWNFWNWISPRFVFSVVVADIDYASFCGMSFIDFESGDSLASTTHKLPGSLDMPEHVDRTIRFEGGRTLYRNLNEGGDIQVEFDGRAKDGREVVAEFLVKKPADHESLNVLVPWTSERFQLNAKTNTLPCDGYVTIGDRRYAMDPAECHAVQDFGRGVWPYRSHWNWGACTGVQDGNLIGVNMGAKWTTGTGANENGICFNGRLYKVMEDLRWTYDTNDWMKPWSVRSEHSDMIDLTLYPLYAKASSTNLGIIATGGACSFGQWQGTVRFAGQTVEIEGLIGWAEEFAHRW